MPPIVPMSDTAQIGPTPFIGLAKSPDKLGRLGGQAKQVEVLQCAHHGHERAVLLFEPVQYYGKFGLFATDFPRVAPLGDALATKQMFRVTFVLDEQHADLGMLLQVARMRGQIADVDVKTSLCIRNIGGIARYRMAFRRDRGHQQ